MFAGSLNVHKVKRIEVIPVEERDGTKWRRIFFHTPDGIMEVVCFPLEEEKNLAIKFVKEESIS